MALLHQFCFVFLTVNSTKINVNAKLNFLIRDTIEQIQLMNA